LFVCLLLNGTFALFRQRLLIFTMCYTCLKISFSISQFRALIEVSLDVCVYLILVIITATLLSHSFRSTTGWTSRLGKLLLGDILLGMYLVVEEVGGDLFWIVDFELIRETHKSTNHRTVNENYIENSQQ